MKKRVDCRLWCLSDGTRVYASKHGRNDVRCACPAVRVCGRGLPAPVGLSSSEDLGHFWSRQWDALYTFTKADRARALYGPGAVNWPPLT